MKTTNKFIAVSAMVMASAIMLAGCQREPIASAEEEPAAEEVIPVYVEGFNDTKMTIDGTDGTCAWENNDIIMMYVGSNLLVPVVDGAVKVSLTGSQTRSKWAVYPGNQSTAVISSANPTVAFPYQYDMSGGKNLNPNYCPAPMFADNTKNSLKFYHVGGVLRLHLTSFPSNTKSIRVAFTGISNKWGTTKYTVSNAGTASSTISGSANYNYVEFNYLTYASDMTLNIPLPPGSYSSVTAIQIKCCKYDTYSESSSSIVATMSKSVTGWGTVSRAQGIKMSLDFNSISGGIAYTPNPYGFKICRGFLKYDAVNKLYTFTDGTDPLDMLNYTDASTAKGVYYHKYSDIKEFLKVSSLNFATQIPVDGEIRYMLRYSSHIGTLMLGYTSSDIITFNNQSSNRCALKCLVNLSDAIPENGATRDYRNKGFNNASGAYVSAHNGGYVAGFLCFPRSSSVNMPAVSDIYPGSAISNIISFKTLKYFTDNGAIFVPSLGYITSGGAWSGRGTCVYIGQSDQYIAYAYTDSNTVSDQSGSTDVYYAYMLQESYQ